MTPRRPPTSAIALEAAIPPAQIRGLVRDFLGKPVAATVVIEPLGTTATVAADGSFAIDVKPGAYDVSITAKGYAPQKRKVVVEPQAARRSSTSTCGAPDDGRPAARARDGGHDTEVVRVARAARLVRLQGGSHRAPP